MLGELGMMEGGVFRHTAVMCSMDNCIDANWSCRTYVVWSTLNWQGGNSLEGACTLLLSSWLYSV